LEAALKSNVSDLLKVIETVYIDASIKCIADVSDLRDLGTIRSRVEGQGISFLTITLPNFCSDFERSIANGYIDSTAFRFFRKTGQIPSFLKGFVSQIFNFETGRIYDETNSDFPTIVESVRQICLTFKKVEIDCTPERTAAALNSFKAIEANFETFSASDARYKDFLSVSSVLWDNTIVGINPAECVPRHGPGATAEGISGNQKYLWRSWHDRLEPYFPLYSNGYPIGLPLDSEELKLVTIVPEERERPVRVVCVPKTLKSPRIIAIEPCCMQYAQQGIRSALYRAIESSRMAAGHVNFTDQSINQELAISSSSTGQLATIDLSDASDRVPHDLAMEMFRSNPALREAIEACRSTRAELPDGTVLGPLRKFASMGSALCFPIEAMYFYTICVVALLKENNLPVTFRNCFQVSRNVYVYGDDIIVPSTNAMTILEYLRKYNCKVNVNKTFVSGSFRESCGIDAYLGEPVTPVYVRKLRPENRQQADRLISYVATANLFYKKGYWRTATLLFSLVEKILGPLPYVSETSPMLGRISFLGYRSATRWHRGFQRLEIKGWVPSPVYRTDELEGYGALSKCLLKLDDLKNRLVSRDALHLERSALHGAVALKLRWLSAS
jgi:hypothetical protein